MAIIWLFISVVLIIIGTTKYDIHPILALLLAALIFGLGTGMDPISLVDTINVGFGETIGSIGIVIIAGLLIGAFLEHSGGAMALSELILRIIGKKRIHSTMAMMGYVVAIPVFADSGFIILSSLNKTLSSKAGVSIAGTAVSLSLGLMATHTMVPPTPGPIAAAGIIGADLGLVIIYGLIASIISVSLCVLFARYMGDKIQISSKQVQEKAPQNISSDPSNLPAAWHSALPIVIPIVLIILKSVRDLPSSPLGESVVTQIIGFIGLPVPALIIGMLISFTLPKKFSSKFLSPNGWVGKAMASGAVIILITGVGGAFGMVLQQSDLSNLLESSLSSLSIGIWLPYLIAMGLKTAQGSSTVSIITTASIISPLLISMGLDTEIDMALSVVAIGAGAAGVSHANDSFFWVVTQLSELNVSQGYRTHSIGTFLLGFSSMIILTVLQFLI